MAVDLPLLCSYGLGGGHRLVLLGEGEGGGRLALCCPGKKVGRGGMGSHLVGWGVGGGLSGVVLEWDGALGGVVLEGGDGLVEGY